MVTLPSERSAQYETTYDGRSSRTVGNAVKRREIVMRGIALPYVLKNRDLLDSYLNLMETKIDTLAVSHIHLG